LDVRLERPNINLYRLPTSCYVEQHESTSTRVTVYREETKNPVFEHQVDFSFEFRPVSYSRTCKTQFDAKISFNKTSSPF
jgi:hypothetical protein